MCFLRRNNSHSCPGSLAADDTLQDDSRELSNMKRHSEGTFSNDYSKYLEDRKAQDFVRWLMNNKRSGSVVFHSCCSLHHLKLSGLALFSKVMWLCYWYYRHTDGIDWSGFHSNPMEGVCLKRNLFLIYFDHGAQGVWLCSFSTAEKRHADGTFTSDVSSYLKDQAIKDFVARLKAGQVRRE